MLVVVATKKKRRLSSSSRPGRLGRRNKDDPLKVSNSVRFMAVKELSHFRDFRTLNKRRLRSGTLETQPDAGVKGKVVWTQR